MHEVVVPLEGNKETKELRDRILQEAGYDVAKNQSRLPGLPE